MSEWPWVWGAYALTWATLAVYVLYLAARRRRADRLLAAADSGKGGSQ